MDRDDREDQTEMEHERIDIKKKMQYILNMRPVFNKEALFSDGTEYYRADQIQRSAGKTGRKCVEVVDCAGMRNLPPTASYGCLERKKNQPKFCILQNSGWFLRV